MTFFQAPVLVFWAKAATSKSHAVIQRHQTPINSEDDGIATTKMQYGVNSQRDYRSVGESLFTSPTVEFRIIWPRQRHLRLGPTREIKYS